MHFKIFGIADLYTVTIDGKEYPPLTFQELQSDVCPLPKKAQQPVVAKITELLLLKSQGLA